MCYFSNSRIMKRIVSSKIRVVLSIVFLVAFSGFMSSCEESSMNPTGGGPGAPTGPGANEVFISGSAFTPSSITVTANTSITWTNKDSAPHTVTSNSGAFDSGTINSNGTFSHTFTAAGTYSYHCALHPAMTASVIAN